MAVLVNNFDGGPAGTTVTTANTGQANDDAFDSVSTTGTGAVARFSSALDRATAEFCFETGTGTTATSPYVAWSTSMGAQSTIYTRWYAKFTTLPTSGNNDNVLFMIWSGATHCCSVWVSNTVGGSPDVGRPLILPGGSPSTGMSTAITAGLWVRFEFKAVMSTTVGAGELRLYLDADSDTPTETLIQTNKNYGASSGSSFRLGCANPVSNQTPTMHSGWELNNTGFPGPLPFRAGKGVPGVLSTPIAPHTDAW